MGSVVSPRAQQPAQQTSISPSPATVPHQSPTTTGSNSNLIGVTATHVTAQQPQQQSQQQIPTTTTTAIMKEQPQQPMVSLNSLNFL